MNPEEIADFSDGIKRINVDFDKTLTTGEGPNYWQEEAMEHPDEDMVQWVNDKYHEGHIIIVWTARPWSQAPEVAAFLTRWGVEFNGIRCDKGGADIYIDDKAINTEEVAND
jgi:hypothetical protein